MSFMSVFSDRNELTKTWAPIALAKRYFFLADAQFRMANAAAKSGHYGEQVGNERKKI
jgi:hypothetical protein